MLLKVYILDVEDRKSQIRNHHSISLVSSILCSSLFVAKDFYVLGIDN